MPLPAPQRWERFCPRLRPLQPAVSTGLSSEPLLSTQVQVPRETSPLSPQQGTLLGPEPLLLGQAEQQHCKEETLLNHLGERSKS